MTPRPGAAARGERHYMTKLTEADVRLIRQAVAERRRLLQEARKLSNAALARAMEVKPQTIANIVAGRVWGHVR